MSKRFRESTSRGVEGVLCTYLAKRVIDTIVFEVYVHRDVEVC